MNSTPKDIQMENMFGGRGKHSKSPPPKRDEVPNPPYKGDDVQEAEEVKYQEIYALMTETPKRLIAVQEQLGKVVDDLAMIFLFVLVLLILKRLEGWSIPCKSNYCFSII